jgi:hypothetical protein
MVPPLLIDVCFLHHTVSGVPTAIAFKNILGQQVERHVLWPEHFGDPSKCLEHNDPPKK